MRKHSLLMLFILANSFCSSYTMITLFLKSVVKHKKFIVFRKAPYCTDQEKCIEFIKNYNGNRDNYYPNNTQYELHSLATLEQLIDRIASNKNFTTNVNDAIELEKAYRAVRMAVLYHLKKNKIGS